jgi:hypothetical protein
MKKKPKQKNKGGRPSDYRAQYSEEAREQTLAGATDADLAKYFGVADSTLALWKKKHAGFSEAIRAGKEGAQGKVAGALFKAAVGYDRTVEKVVDGVVVACKEFVPGDVQAMKYFLNNRRHRDWRNDPEVSLEVNNQTLRLPADIIAAARQIAKGG